MTHYKDFYCKHEYIIYMEVINGLHVYECANCGEKFYFKNLLRCPNCGKFVVTGFGVEKQICFECLRKES